MRIRLLLSAAFLASHLGTLAQGIQFHEGSWASVRSKAQQQNRLIYLDVYTTWCVPCKLLASQIFPQKEAGDKFNSLFVNYRVDAEKGEGIVLAKKYGVTAYPTHLFIDPKTESVVYVGSGSPATAAIFNREADIAVEERADPMSWKSYEQAYAKGRRDSSFIIAFLRKATRLNKDNDPIINDYVAILKKHPLRDTDIVFLLEQIRTVDNQAIPLLATNKEIINSRHKDVNNYFETMCRAWAFATLEKAVNHKNTSILETIDHILKTYTNDPDEALPYWFRTQYFQQIDDKDKALIAARNEADFLCSQPEKYFLEGDEKGLEESKDGIRWQLRRRNVPDEQIEEMVDTNLKLNPSMRYPKTFRVATKLNDNSWYVYEHHAKDSLAVQQALKWSQKAMELTQNMNQWSGFADTRSHLLYVCGKKEEAIRLQQQAVEHARKKNQDGITDLEDSLKKMQEQTL